MSRSPSPHRDRDRDRDTRRNSRSRSRSPRYDRSDVRQSGSSGAPPGPWNTTSGHIDPVEMDLPIAKYVSTLTCINCNQIHTRFNLSTLQNSIVIIHDGSNKTYTTMRACYRTVIDNGEKFHSNTIPVIDTVN